MDKNEKNIEKTGISYLQAFAENVYLLLRQAAAYNNLLILLEQKNPTAENQEENDETQLRGYIEMLRHTIYLNKIQYRAITKNLDGLKENPELMDLFNEINKTHIINRDVLENLVLLLNIELMKNPLKGLLLDSEKFIENRYNETSNQ